MADLPDPLIRDYLEIRRDDLDFGDIIGTGSHGTVYKAQWNNKIVAVKTLHNLKEREAQVLNGIRHRNIVRFYGAMAKVPDFWIVTEYCEGGCLFDYLKNNSICFEQAEAWAIGIAEGMFYLHNDAPEAPIMHRSLTSVNVVLSKENTAKICGFGYSKSTHSTQSTASYGKTQMYAWKAPEVIKGSGACPESDVYSYSMILWQLVTQQEPFSGQDMCDVADKIKRDERPIIPPLCRPAWTQLIKDCWKTNPKDRPSFRVILERLKGATPSISPPQDNIRQITEDTPPSWSITKTLTQVSRLDSGKFGVVYEATLDGTKVAARYLDPEDIQSSEDFRKFMDITSEIEHDNIIKVIGGKCKGPTMIIVTEWFPTTLHKEIKNRGSIDRHHLKPVGLDVARGLKYLHTPHPFTTNHRRLTSANVLVDPHNIEWKVKIADFGFRALSQRGLVSSIDAYVAPEARDGANQSTKMDVYSYGVLLFEMKTGQLPQRGVPTLQDLKRKVGEQLGGLVLKCMDPEQDDRPTMEMVMEELNDKL